MFAGKARRRAYCELCLSEFHATQECPEATWQQPWAWPPAPEVFTAGPSGSTPYPHEATSLLLPYPANSTSYQHNPKPRPQREICLKFQTGSCTFQPCKFLHICLHCNALHPGSGCPTRPIAHDGSHAGSILVKAKLATEKKKVHQGHSRTHIQLSASCTATCQAPHLVELDCQSSTACRPIP